MRSVADALRAGSRDAEARLTAEQRLRLALSLGRRDIRLLASARCMSETEAARELGRQRQQGRRHSSSHLSLFT